jgi:ADP-ribose pyrophosphatase YjhB (NUDIX family)
MTSPYGEEFVVRANGQVWRASWCPPPTPPDGTPHGSLGICVTDGGDVVLVSEDGKHWDLPAGRPEGDETWEQTLRREMLEEACATVVQARLLGFSRGACIEGPEQGLIFVRSLWRADVELAPWEPKFEIAHRRLVTPAEVESNLLAGSPFAPIIRRALVEAGVI